ncbi:aminoglycoside phosphotransferase (APT) family kinase protein [Allocatelliglobosispora scoriae]|uniref:Aminoglycoside phosphotransferase (APT) family kinase protein n=1 Tax=Allocatelliglobosispora scoriae TaxID=643052 RepID=A0A841C2Q8_9ACTN|nr:aminoglycoside phosphotransferase family protein [Allocatelliglobosispora scoriae]MBB5873332.1 aminoglycoside phosphotransferase (APT) family kinase protein [Allocatelliglobosispora scoriae]
MMHEGEIRTDAELVRRLVARQFPQWADLPVTPMPIGGTDHALYRLGDDLIARMPRIDWAIDQAASDERWLPVLAPHLPLTVPAPLGVGEPGEGYPWQWSVVPYLPGENPAGDNVDLDRAAVDLAAFVLALHSVDTTGGPVKAGMDRGVPLAARDELTRTAIAELGDRVDTAAVTRAWDDAVSAEPWGGPPVWIHGDLQAGNLLVHDRRLSAVIDFGALGLGDPAPDLAPAWSVFDASSRETYRRALGYDEDTWRRGRGWALSTALVAMPYYWDTAPAMIAEGRLKIAAVLADLG